MDASSADPLFTDTLSLALSTVIPVIAGPKRPQDKVALSDLPKTFAALLPDSKPTAAPASFPVENRPALQHGDVVIAAITSCTNTSNPSVLIAAGLLAKKAIEKGLTCQPWVKTSLAPGSKVVTDYPKQAYNPI